MVGRYIEYTLEANDPQSIALPQVSILNVPLILNGKLGNRPYNITGPLGIGFSYCVSITTITGDGGDTFTINGYQNGVFATVNLTAAPAGNNVFATTVLFDSVVSVTPIANAVSAISVGTGISNADASTIYSLPIMIDFPYRKGIDCVVTIEGKDGATSSVFNANYTIYGSVANIVNNGMTIPSMEGNQLVPLVDNLYQPIIITPLRPYVTITQAFRYIVVQITTAAPYTFPSTIVRFSQCN